MNKIFILTMIISLSLMACNKDAVLENDVDNNELGLVQIDSFTLKSKTIIDEPIQGNNISTILLGQINDNRFGESKASFYTQFSLSKNSYSLGTNPVLDSVVLILDQVDSYGELNSEFDISVYELESTLLNEPYDNNSVLNINSNTLANVNNYTFYKGKSSIRIPLSTTFGISLMDLFGTDVMESSENFKDHFKGMYVTTNTINGDGLIYLKLISENSKMELFYHNDEVADTSYYFPIEKKDQTLTQYINNGIGTEVLDAINSEDETIAYIGSMSSYKTELQMPDLSSLKDVVINKATITVYQADFGSSESIMFEEPKQLILFQNLQDTSISFLDGYSINTKIGPIGENNKVEINGSNTVKYTFQVTDYIQKLITSDTKSKILYLKDLGNNEGSRIKIGGGSNSELPMKLDIVYTKLN